MTYRAPIAAFLIAGIALMTAARAQTPPSRAAQRRAEARRLEALDPRPPLK